MPMNCISSYNKILSSRGFTLIEFIMVIVLLSVIGMLGGNFIAQSFKGFAQSENRIEIYEEGKMALARMEREIHNAIPNAFNPASATDLQFGMMDEEEMRRCVGADCVFGQYTNNNPTNNIRDRSLAVPASRIVSVYNLNWTTFTVAANLRLYEITSVVSTNRMNITPNIVASSPNKRFYAVDQGVRYCLDGDILRRDSQNIVFSNYTNWLGASNFSLPCVNGMPMARGVTNLAFNYLPGTATNSPIITVDFIIARNNESLNFHKEIVVLNVP